jgi:hypothetical protein
MTERHALRTSAIAEPTCAVLETLVPQDVPEPGAR